MHSRTKKFIAKTSIAAGVGVGSLLGARSMEVENPHKPDLEWVGQVALLGSAFAVAKRGITAFAISNFERDAVRDDAEIKRLKAKLPEIESIRDPYRFFRHLKEHDPTRVDDATTVRMLSPVLRAFEHSPKINAFKYESLIWTVDAMRDRMRNALDSDEYETDIVEVTYAAWFLDQTFPIATSDTSTPEYCTGERHWYDFVLHSILREEAVV